MPREVHAVVQHAADLQSAVGRQAGEWEVARFPNAALSFGDVVAAVEEMVGQRAFGEFGPGTASQPTGVRGQIEYGMNNKRLVAEASLFAETLLASGEDRLQVPLGKR